MGQAKNRKAEIEQLKSQGPRARKDDLNNLMMSFGDEPNANDIRFEMLRSLLQIPLANRKVFEQNALMGKTTHMGGLDLQMGTTKIDIEDIHFGLNKPSIGWAVINAVLADADPTKLRPMCAFWNGSFSTGFGYATPYGCLSIRHNSINGKVHTVISIDNDVVMTEFGAMEDVA